MIRKILFITGRRSLGEKESAKLITRKSITFVKCEIVTHFVYTFVNKKCK